MGMQADGIVDELLIKEWQQAMTSYHEIIKLMIQSWGFIIAAEAIFVGLGVNAHHSATFFGAATLTLLMVAMYRRFLSHAIPFALTAIRAEFELRPTSTGTETPLASYFSTHYANVFKAIRSDFEKSGSLASKDVPSPSWSPMMIAMILVSIVQLAFSILLLTVWDYSFL